MCGIAGIFNYRRGDSRSAEAGLVAASERMATRGPDGQGLWFNDDRRLGFAHRRLAIIDLDDRALQPMHFPERGLSIIFNGEIYNYQELREELARERGVRFRTESDTEVLLALFDACGPRMVEKLRGMFALAIWDQRAGRLFLARDPYGIKPLYYADEGGIFRFASQVKALAEFRDLSGEPDSAGIVGFQMWGSVPEPFTTYRAIRALPAGCRMWIGSQGPEEPERYAKVSAVLAAASEDRAANVKATVAAAAADSVRAHLVADVEVGVFLSSGIDSGSLVGLMRDAGQNRIRAITLEFEELRGTPSDETPLAREVAKRYGAEHHVQTVTAQDFAASAESILDHMDQPSIDGVNSWFVSRAAHDCGLKVVLSGLGGDELLGGYSNFRTVPRTRRVWGKAARLPLAPAFARFAIARFAPRLAARNPKALGALEHASTWAGAYMLRRAVLLPFEAERRLDREMAREGLERLGWHAGVEDAITPDPGSDMGRVSALESSLYMRNQLLRDADWASMAHSLELRVPFVDWATLHRIAPVLPRLAEGVGKRALARSPSRPLPEEVIARGRSGFTIPIAKWMGKTADPTDRLGSRHWASRVAKSFGLTPD